jgi:putative acetyltransferase
MRLRAERADDHPAIARVTTAAFGSEREARMIDAIRSSDGFVPELSLVAEVDGRIVGHVILSYVGLEGADRRVLELGPMSVEPERQRAGIGSALVREALRGAEARGEPLVLVLGHPSYYPRFGFRPAAELRIHPPDQGIPAKAFMAIALSAYDPELRGRVIFPPAFSAYVPSSQEARYLACSSVSSSMATPIVSSFSRAISLSISSGTG